MLEELLADADPSLSPTPVQLWPEHFDLSIELGDQEAGRRATYGASPGDEEHPEPYLYVATWNPPPEGPLWNATAFTGAELAYAELIAAATGAPLPTTSTAPAWTRSHRSWASRVVGA